MNEQEQASLPVLHGSGRAYGLRPLGVPHCFSYLITFCILHSAQRGWAQAKQAAIFAGIFDEPHL